MGAVGLILAAASPAVALDARRVPSSRPVTLEDTAGRPVGRVVGVLSPETVAVWLRTGSSDLLLRATREKLGTSSAFGLLLQLQFETTDCTGSGYLVDLAAVLPQPLDVLAGVFTPSAVGPGNVVFAATGQTETRHIQAAWDPSGDEPCVTLPGADRPVRPTTGVLDLGQFVPPFRLR
jgi:hypothetical protein